MTEPISPTGAEVCKFLQSLESQATRECDLQDALALAFHSAGFDVQREHWLGQGDRIDFYFPGTNVGVEVKCKGSLSSVTRQLFRYSLSSQIDSLVLCTTLVKHTRLPPVLGQTSVRVVCLASL